jgi:hypothetical protein
LIVALCACSVSLRRMGTAYALMDAERGLSCGAVTITSVTLFPVTTSVTWTVPNRFCSAVPAYVLGALLVAVAAGVAVAPTVEDAADVGPVVAAEVAVAPASEDTVAVGLAVAAGVAVAPAAEDAVDIARVDVAERGVAPLKLEVPVDIVPVAEAADGVVPLAPEDPAGVELVAVASDVLPEPDDPAGDRPPDVEGLSATRFADAGARASRSTAVAPGIAMATATIRAGTSRAALLRCLFMVMYPPAVFG